MINQQLQKLDQKIDGIQKQLKKAKLSSPEKLNKLKELTNTLKEKTELLKKEIKLWKQW